MALASFWMLVTAKLNDVIEWQSLLNSVLTFSAFKIPSALAFKRRKQLDNTMYFIKNG